MDAQSLIAGAMVNMWLTRIGPARLCAAVIETVKRNNVALQQMS